MCTMYLETLSTRRPSERGTGWTNQPSGRENGEEKGVIAEESELEMECEIGVTTSTTAS